MQFEVYVFNRSVSAVILASVHQVIHQLNMMHGAQATRTEMAYLQIDA